MTAPLATTATTVRRLAGEYPILLLAQRYKPGKFFGGLTVFGRLCCLLTITCQNFGDLVALR